MAKLRGKATTNAIRNWWMFSYSCPVRQDRCVVTECLTPTVLQLVSVVLSSSFPSVSSFVFWIWLLTVKATPFFVERFRFYLAGVYYKAIGFSKRKNDARSRPPIGVKLLGFASYSGRSGHGWRTVRHEMRCVPENLRSPVYFVQ